MKRVVIFGRGGAGKSTLAVRLSKIKGLPLVELDKIFWGPGLTAMSRQDWSKTQERLVGQDRWILDGDLGPYDAVEVRLRAADTVILLDFSIVRCAWRSFRRSHERLDFWLWLLSYRRKSRPILMKAIAKHAANAEFYILRNPREVDRFVDSIARSPRL